MVFSAALSQASEPNKWVLIARSASGKDFYIDSDSLNYQLLKKKLSLREEQIARAWFKIVPNHEDKQKKENEVQNYINEELGYATALIETNCSNSTLRVFVVNIYDNNYELAYRIETLRSQFEAIPSGAVFADIKNIICSRKLYGISTN